VSGPPAHPQRSVHAPSEEGPHSGWTAPGCRWPNGRPRDPLQATSREIVDGARLRRLPIARNESPAVKPREISSSSASDRRCGERSLARRFSPPVKARNRWIDFVEQPTAAAAVSNVSPLQNEPLYLGPVRITQTPGVARPIALHPGLPEYVTRIIAEMLRRSLETTPGISCEAVPASERDGLGMRRHLHPSAACGARVGAAESFVSFIPLLGRPTHA
jgi:hypothetical protein